MAMWDSATYEYLHFFHFELLHPTLGNLFLYDSSEDKSYFYILLNYYIQKEQNEILYGEVLNF